jgi:uncharacterized membrane protein YqgA involved in biofilm formation
VGGNLIDVLAILLAGLPLPDLTPTRQNQLRHGLAGLSCLLGGWVVYDSLGATFRVAMTQVGVGILSLILGNLTGRILRLQTAITAWSRRLAPHLQSGRSDGRAMMAWAVVLGLNPLAIPGALLDGAAGRWGVLAIKAVMDLAAVRGLDPGLRARSWLLALQIGAWQGLWVGGAHSVVPWLKGRMLDDSVLMASGWLVIIAAVPIAGLRAVPMANYLPVLVWAPVLTAMLR